MARGAIRIEVGEDDAERRLDALIRRRFGLPRPLVMKLIRKGDVRLNGRRADPAARLAIGDRVEVAGVRAPPAPARAAGRAAPRRAPATRVDPRAIVYEDADILVFDKPPGVVAHAGSGHERGVVDALIAYLDIPPGAPRPALVNRLDRDTSGLIVLARTPLALRRLNAAIRRGEMKKGYLALVRGAPAPEAGEIRGALAKRRGPDGLERMEVLGDGEGGLPALTRYRTERRLAGGRAALLALAPETGRTHQLRAHLAWRGHPIALDRKYGDARFNAEIEEGTGLRRLFLHASALAFPHPRTGAPVRVAAPLPPDLVAALEWLARGGKGKAGCP